RSRCSPNGLRTSSTKPKSTTIRFSGFLPASRTARFAVIYSHGSTIELVHPSFDILAHICGVTREPICLILNENEIYRRAWVARRSGCTLIQGERPIAPESESSLLILRRT